LRNVRHKRRKINDSGILLQKDMKNEQPTTQNGTFGFSRHTSLRSKNQKSHFFANAHNKINE